MLETDLQNMGKWDKHWDEDARTQLTAYIHERNKDEEEVAPSACASDHERATSRAQLEDAISRALERYPEGSSSRTVNANAAAAEWESRVFELCQKSKKAYGYEVSLRVGRVQAWAGKDWIYKVFEGYTGREALTYNLRNVLGFPMPDEAILESDVDTDGSTDDESVAEEAATASQGQTSDNGEANVDPSQDEIDAELFALAGGDDQEENDDDDDNNNNDNNVADDVNDHDSDDSFEAQMNQAIEESLAGLAGGDDEVNAPGSAGPSSSAQHQSQPTPQHDEIYSQSAPITHLESDAGSEGPHGLQQHASAEQTINPQLLSIHEESFESSLPSQSAMGPSSEHVQGAVQHHQHPAVEEGHIPQPATSHPQWVVPDEQQTVEATQIPQLAVWQQEQEQQPEGHHILQPETVIQQQYLNEIEMTDDQQLFSEGDFTPQPAFNDQSVSGGDHIPQQAFFQQEPQGQSFDEESQIPQTAEEDEMDTSDDTQLSIDGGLQIPHQSVEEMSTPRVEEMEIDSVPSIATETLGGQAVNFIPQSEPTISEEAASDVDQPAPAPVVMPFLPIFGAFETAAAAPSQPVSFSIDFGVTTSDLSGLRSFASQPPVAFEAPQPITEPVTTDNASPKTLQEPGESPSIVAPAAEVQSEMERPLAQVSETAQCEAVEVSRSTECEEDEQVAALAKQFEAMVLGGTKGRDREAEKPDNIDIEPAGAQEPALAFEPETRPSPAVPVDATLEMLWSRVMEIQQRVPSALAQDLAWISSQSAETAKPATSAAAPAAKDSKTKKPEDKKKKKKAKKSSTGGKKSARVTSKAPLVN
ncbi:hypothetical protein IQ07DRAFT_642002 [Pyrenochaeta sp. DS3sAY3a]|nr:hypothetical protein IQ07DRAFT_642002 [Pyrenochaeta sp. DS3sAY3a]